MKNQRPQHHHQGRVEGRSTSTGISSGESWTQSWPAWSSDFHFDNWDAYRLSLDMLRSALAHRLTGRVTRADLERYQREVEIIFKPFLPDEERES